MASTRFDSITTSSPVSAGLVCFVSFRYGGEFGGEM